MNQIVATPARIRMIKIIILEEFIAFSWDTN
jgi:hypothetical protein